MSTLDASFNYSRVVFIFHHVMFETFFSPLLFISRRKRLHLRREKFSTHFPTPIHLHISTFPPHRVNQR